MAEWEDNLEPILERLRLLHAKYEGMGQDMLSYLDGLYYSNGLAYWDYVHLDSLLGLQSPRTPFKDEMIFLVYHQITELMFKLVKHELDQLTNINAKEPEHLVLANWYKRVPRLINYFKHLCSSFDIMMSGMDFKEFKKFRMALLPASGFQSVQIRHIEIMSTNLWQLIGGDNQVMDADSPIETLYPYIYWKQGGIDLETKKKTITLREFEAQYDESLKRMIQDYKYRNLAYLFFHLPDEMKQDEKLRNMLKEYDTYVNIYWKMSHYSAAARHLVKGNIDIDATGGTNWRTFLPPQFQKIIFFPSLWSDVEQDEWGKAGILKMFKDMIAKGWMKPPTEKVS